MSEMDSEQEGGFGREGGLGDLPGGDEGDLGMGFGESGLGDAGLEAGLGEGGTSDLGAGGLGDLPGIGDDEEGVL